MASPSDDRSETQMSLPRPAEASSSARSTPAPVPVSERRQGVTTGADHTRVPNWLFQFVFPLLSLSEQSCLLYILRRTYGFANGKGSNTRKQWDRIALSQFIDGNNAHVHKNGENRRYALDLGTGLARGSVIKALASLEEKELVRVSYECPTSVTKSGRATGCGWNESDDDHLIRPEIDARTKAYKCPRCKRTLSKAYALRTLTPGFIKRFLSKHDPSGLQWSYDPEVGRFYAVEGAAPAPAPAADPAEQITQIKAQLWFPELVERIVGDANSVLKSKRMAEKRVVNGFYQPAVELQEAGFPKEAVKYGLEQVIKRRIAAQSHNRNWHGYAKACATGWLERNLGGKEQAQAEKKAVNTEQLLGECSQLNKAGEREQARKLLHDLLASGLDQLTGEFGGDRALAKRHVLEAFKRGLADYRSVRDYMVSIDYLPEWTWEADEARS